MGYDRKGSWLDSLTQSGYLGHFLEDLKNQEEDLLDLLQPLPESLKPLYIYESKLSLFCRLAHSPQGSRALIELGFLRYLLPVRFLDQPPEESFRNSFILLSYSSLSSSLS